MHKVEARLTEWIKAYERLKEAQDRYKVPLVNRQASEQLREEVDRLQRQAEVALRELQVEFAHARRRMSDPSAS